MKVWHFVILSALLLFFASGCAHKKADVQSVDDTDTYQYKSSSSEDTEHGDQTDEVTQESYSDSTSDEEHRNESTEDYDSQEDSHYGY